MTTSQYIYIPIYFWTATFFSYGYDETMLCLKIYLYSNIFLFRSYNFDCLKSIHCDFALFYRSFSTFNSIHSDKFFILKSLETNLCLFYRIFSHYSTTKCFLNQKRLFILMTTSTCFQMPIYFRYSIFPLPVMLRQTIVSTEP